MIQSGTGRVWRILWLSPLVVPVALWLLSLSSRDVEDYIGEFVSHAAGERAAIKQLAAQLKRRPYARQFHITRIQINSGLNGIYARWPGHTYYDPRTQKLEDGGSFHEGRWLWKRVTPAMILAVAQRGGTFADFKPTHAEGGQIP